MLTGTSMVIPAFYERVVAPILLADDMWTVHVWLVTDQTYAPRHSAVQIGLHATVQQ